MAKPPGAPLGFAIAGLGMAGAVMVRAAAAHPGVKVVAVFPEDSHPPIIYPVAATTAAKPDATPYLAFLQTQSAKIIFETYGFTVLVKPAS